MALSEVYPPEEDTFLLIDALHAASGAIADLGPMKLCVEIGCGSGSVTKELVRMLGSGSIVIAHDVNVHATEQTQQLLQSECEGSLWEVAAADLTDSLRCSVDLLVFNPPYVPTDQDEYARALAERNIYAAWAGGKDGREVIDRFMDRLPARMSSGGLVFLVALEANHPHEILEKASSMGFTAEVTLTRSAGIEKLYVLKFQLP